MSRLLNAASEYAVAENRLEAAREALTAATAEVERASMREAEAQLDHAVCAKALLAAAQDAA